MFGVSMFGVGPAEIAIIAFIGMLFLGGLGGIVLMVLLVARGKGSRIAALEEENRNLREQLAASQAKPPVKAD